MTLIIFYLIFHLLEYFLFQMEYYFGKNLYFCSMLYFNYKYLNRLLKRSFLPMTAVAAFLYSCASVGTLGGGDYDETPPKFLKGTPAPNELNASRKRITIEFDEYLKLDKPQEKIVISPPQVQQANVRASGKKVLIDLQDTLIPNTTYTVDFGDAIQDNNESNPLENFVYTFSTGERLDTMEVAGTVLNAMNLEPIKGMMVGLHADLGDSAFISKPFDRVGRTDSRGHFTIKGIAPGEYHIFGLQENDQNYFYSQPTEMVAFNDSLVIPTFELRMRQDTTWIDSLVIDTIVERQYTHYLPDKLILKAFINNKKDQRLAKSERTTNKDFTLFFTAPADTFPTIRGLNFDETDAFVIERLTERIDTLKYLKAYGRVSGAAAFFADTLNIKPLIMADVYGNNYTFKKVHGPMKAMVECFEYVKKHMVEGVTDIVYIGETMPGDAKAYLKKRLEEELHLKTAEYIISPIVGVCCGPGMYGCWFKGDLVTEMGAKK